MGLQTIKTETAQDKLQQLFLSYAGKRAASIVPMQGDGSARKLFRITGGGRTAIGVVNSDIKENTAFLEFSRHFFKCGLPVPEIYAQTSDKRIYLEEDLGDTTLFDFLAQNRKGQSLAKPAAGAYRQAVEILPQFQIKAGKTLDYRFCYPRSSFDKQSLRWDMNHFKYYFLKLGGISFDEQSLEEDFERFADFLARADRDFFLYRDFQSRNIMLKNGRPYFIDYQGGRKGALQYDIASLLYDAKADLPQSLRDELLELYLASAAQLAPVDRKEFLRYYPGFVYIRIMQALGAYGLRGFHEKKSHFLQSIPYAVQNIEFLLRKAKLPVKLPALTAALKNIVGSSRLRQFGAARLSLTVRVQSFSYRGGIPADEHGHGGGFVFDCRALPNPGKYEKYAALTGKSPAVAGYLRKEPAVARFMRDVCSLVGAAVENYRQRNFTDLMVSFGCTGGRHRSVYCAELLARYLKSKCKAQVELSHREQPQSL